MSETIEDLVFRLASERGLGKTICPTEAAKAAAEQRGEDDWQGRLPDVRAAAVRLAKRGRLAITRKGKPVDPDDFKGVYRIGLPPADEVGALIPPQAELGEGGPSRSEGSGGASGVEPDPDRSPPDRLPKSDVSDLGDS